MLQCSVRRYTSRPCQQIRQLLVPQQRKPLSNHVAETVEVPVRSHGSITLDICYPTVSPPALSKTPAALIYMPRGPFLNHGGHDAATLSSLRSALPFPVIQVNYRLGREHRYPTPFHDVLAGYDWILKHLLPKRDITHPGQSETLGRVAVCGELIGGGLAAMLALTECRIGQPGVVAAAVSNPVVDWVDFGTEPSKSHSNPATNVGGLYDPTLQLWKLRNEIFKKPEDRFDPFASPILFFRTAGEPVPAPEPDVPEDDMEHLSFLDRQDFFREQLALSSLSSTASDEQEPAEPGRKIRRVSRRFPSAALGLQLPDFRIFADGGPLLCHQATELAKQLEKADLRQTLSPDSNSKMFDHECEPSDGDKWKQQASDADAERSVSLQLDKELTLWGDTEAGKARVMAMAEWLRAKLV